MADRLFMIALSPTMEEGTILNGKSRKEIPSKQELLYVRWRPIRLP
jgi:hypothetical protein